MDFRDSPAEATFRAEVRAFLQEHAPKDYVHAYSQNVDDEVLLRNNRDWQRTLYQHGWAALTWPREYGGRGQGPIEQIVWNHELARAGLGESLFVVGIGMAGPTIIAHGTDAQRERFLDPMLRGDELWCQLFSEPGAGSDLAGLSCRAVRDGDDWVITGQKTWCSGAHYGDWGILLTRTDPSVPKHNGITFFLVDMKTPGIEVRPLRQMTGGEHFNEVFFNEARIPDAHRLGPEGGGWAVAKTTLMHERMAIGGIELMSFRWEDFVAHANAHRERIDGVLCDEIGRLYTSVKTLELLNARMITKLGRGEMPAAEASVMKLAMARIVSQGGEVGLRLLGPDAMQKDGTWQDVFLMAPSFHIAGGTDEIQKNQAAERVLGLPREVQPDRDVPFDQIARS